MGELISTIIGLVLLVLWVIGQIADSHKKPQAPQRPRGPRPNRPAHDQADPLRREVEEFLRRARDDGSDKQQRPKPPRKAARAVPDVEVLLDDPPMVEEAALQPQRRTLVRQPLAPPAQKQVSLEKDKPRRVSVAEHARMAIGARSFRDETSHLGEVVAHADDKLESRLHAKFDHDVGRLTAVHAENAYEKRVQVNELTAQVAELLATPQGVQQAVVLNEILLRPTDRW